MQQSKYNQLLDSKHDIFAERLKELRKEKGLTNLELATELDCYTEAGLKNWGRKGGSFPPLKILLMIADFFNVDVGYLLGEQDCKRIATQQISDLTGFSEKSADILREYSGKDSFLDRFLSNDEFLNLFYNMVRYTYSHNTRYKPEDESAPALTPLEQREISKFLATDIFSRILDSMYEENTDLMIYEHDKEVLKEMVQTIHKFYKISQEYSDAKEMLFNVIKSDLNRLSSKEFKSFRELSVQEVYDNYLEIAKELEVSLEE